MARHSYPSDPRSTGSQHGPVPPLFSPASQRHPSTASDKNQPPPITHHLTTSEPNPRQPQGGAGLAHYSGKSPMLPPLPKRDTVATVPHGLNPVGSLQDVKAGSGVTQPGISNLDSSGQQNQPLQDQAIANLQQTLDTPLEASIFEAALLEQLEDSPDQALGHGDIKADAGIPEMVPEDLRRRRCQRQKRSLFTGLAWPILWLLMLTGLAGSGSLAFLWMTSLPPSLDCKELSPLSADAKRLHCADIAAASGQLEDIQAGFDLVRPWSSRHPLFPKAQEVMATWTGDVIAMAETTLYSKGLTEALALLATVPSTSPLYDQVAQRQQEWQGLWDRGEAIEQTALAAVRAAKWDVAAQQVVEMGQLNHPYWRQERANVLSLRVVAERQGLEIYQQAQQMAIASNPESLATALTELQKIQPQTLVWQQAQADLTQWSEIIAQESQRRFQAGDIEGMLALVQALPATPELLPQINDLMKIGYAQRQADDDPENWTPGLIPVAKFLSALTTAAQVETDSPFYDYTQTQLAGWQQQLQDLTQLQLAQAIAATGHRFALDIAIDQASLVDKGQPRRLQAQTLIADWRLDIERVEDRADLALAHQMAAPGTLAALARAIAQAETIEANRVLRPDADQAITEWVTQMQIIEDQPILDRATELATTGDWQAAIAEARTIGRDRALYDTAQTQIGNWQAAIVVAEHRALLARARSLAAQVRLTAAINLARSIPASSTSVYNEAQGAIAQWSRERDRIWAERNQPATPAPSPTPRPAASASPAPRPAPAPAPSPQPSSNFEGYYDSRYYDYYGN